MVGGLGRTEGICVRGFFHASTTINAILVIRDHLKCHLRKSHIFSYYESRQQSGNVIGIVLLLEAPVIQKFAESSCT